MVRLVASCVNRSDVENLFPGRVRKTAPCKTEYAKRDQDDPKCLVHVGMKARAIRHPIFRVETLQVRQHSTQR